MKNNALVALIAVAFLVCSSASAQDPEPAPPSFPGLAAVSIVAQPALGTGIIVGGLIASPFSGPVTLGLVGAGLAYTYASWNEAIIEMEEYREEREDWEEEHEDWKDRNPFIEPEYLAYRNNDVDLFLNNLYSAQAYHGSLNAGDY